MKAKFLVNAGDHSENGRTYKKGQTVESSIDLVKVFGDKFTRINEQVAPAAIATNKEENTTNDGGSSATVTPPFESELGEDVTKDFPSAAEADLRVVKRGTKFHVVDPDEPNDALNEKGLKQSEVDGFVQKYLKS